MVEEQDCLTVTQLTKYIKRKFDADPYLNREVYLVGQLTNFRKRAKHQYFALKDEQETRSSMINVVMFQAAFSRVAFEPENGQRVIIRGHVTVYPQNGQYQLYAESMEIAGVGSLQVRFEQLVKKLRAEGLFDQPKRALRPFPQRVAVVTSNDAAVKHDIITTVRRRNRLVQLVFYPTRVQGQGAAEEIAAQIKRVAEDGGYDALIVARGGGSLEDLWPFNEEVVGRAVAAASLPVVSSIGHETDTTVTDLVADVRSATPTAAAEAVTGLTLADAQAQLTSFQTQLYRIERDRLNYLQERLKQLTDSYPLRQPARIYQGPAQQVDQLTDQLTRTEALALADRRRMVQEAQGALLAQAPQTQLARRQRQVATLTDQLTRALDQQVNRHRQHLRDLEGARARLSDRLLTAGQGNLRTRQQAFHALMGQLDALSPLKILQRGYAYVTKDDQLVANSDQLAPGDSIQVHLASGRAKATVTAVDKEGSK